MKHFYKGALAIFGCIIAVPVFIALLITLFGLGALIITIPDIVIGIVILLAILCIPGLIIGLIIGSK
ncbi:hypothetical protein [Lachnoclostridium sp. Marseille-P6806]|uniref:hypothetical protein n=1 Tax=Lachnoclostridium sp. Marseille-P6806 TaxID=2364793 RepID=UPI0010322C59|nr:hypothetical protein [Lachnoclostridium sp. Marseille-P6806]